MPADEQAHALAVPGGHGLPERSVGDQVGVDHDGVAPVEPAPQAAERTRRAQEHVLDRHVHSTREVVLELLPAVVDVHRGVRRDAADRVDRPVDEGDPARPGRAPSDAAA